MESFFAKKRKEEEQKKLLEIPKTSMLVGDKKVLLEDKKPAQAALGAKKAPFALLEENSPLLLGNDIEGRARADFEMAVKREKARIEGKKAKKKKRKLRKLRKKQKEEDNDKG
ncbi:Uncharacterised protein [Candidatus Anstonella stagnisolia]|nr:Uncharacterised protein [Candidatus Anstonella stagnisolia]